MTKTELLAVAKPILFNTEMVRAILDGRKTVTRRVVKPRYRADESGFQVITTMNGEFIRIEKVDENECGIFSDGTERYVNTPHNPGDYLYVQETWAVAGTYENVGTYGFDVSYKASNGVTPCIFKDIDRYVKFSKFEHKNGWQSPYFMPKEAARLFLRVTDVRAERLQDMNLDSFLSEGVGLRPEAFNDPDNAYGQARSQFSSVWDSTIKKADLDKYSWSANPWVWVIEFERVNIDG